LVKTYCPNIWTTFYNDNDNIKESHMTASFNYYKDELVALTWDFPLPWFS